MIVALWVSSRCFSGIWGLTVVIVQERSLLNLGAPLEDSTEEHEVITAPLFTRDAYLAAGMADKHQQYGVMGSVVAIK